MKTLRNSRRFSTLVTSLAVLALSLSAGCHMRLDQSDAASPVVAATQPPVVLAMAPVDVKRYRPNEAGVVPILEYHDIVTTSHVHGYQYPAVLFRRDLDYLYSHGYRPINLSDYVRGRIDCPAGTTPVILTFDDALRGQFHYLPDGSIDPDCAVGILDAFHAEHPDWALKGTFFVLTNVGTKLPPPFYQSGSSQKKMEYLVGEGYEIGNHTVHHKMGMNHFSDDQVQWEFANAVANIHTFLPGYNVDTLALPYGVYPRNRKLVIDGESGGIPYANICAMLAGANPAPSPMAKKFSPYRLPRIIPGKETYALAYWFSYFEKHKSFRFISDGDPNTYTVAASDKSKIDITRLRADHYFLRVYSGSKVTAVVSPPKAVRSTA